MIRPFFRRAMPPRYSLSINAGDGQSATVASAVPIQPKVRVLDQSGAAVVGAQILWTVANDASVTGGGLLAIVATDASGYSAVDHTLSPTIGANVLTATLPLTGAVVTFTQTGTAGAAAILLPNSASTQAGSTSGAVTAVPSVLVTDTYGNPVSGTTISWAVASGGGSLNTTGGTTTGANGVATLTSWTLGASAGANSITATAAGLTGSPVTFSASASAGTPTQIAVTAGATQTGVVAGAPASIITFTVRDGSNAPVEHITVQFLQSGTGSLSVATADTNASGEASVTLTTGALIETNTVTGQFAQADGTIILASTTVASTFGAKAQLGFQTEPSTSGSSGTALSQQPVILIQDANGNTVTSATDTITCTVGSGNATITNPSPATATAVAGLATFSGLTVTDVDGGTNVFHFAASGLTGCDSSGTILAPPVPVALAMGTQPSNAATGATAVLCTVRIVDSNGTTVPGATDAVTAALTIPGGATLGGTTTVNAVNGVASFALSVDTAASYTLTFTSGTLTQVVSASFTISAASATYPNEPGYAAMASQPCDQVIGSTEGAYGGTGRWRLFSGAGNFAAVTPSSLGTFSPAGGTGIWRIQYPANQQIGSSSINMAGWSNATNNTAAEKSTVYLGFWFNAYGNGTNFEFAPTVFKPFGYMGVGVGAGATQNQLYWEFSSGAIAGSQVTSISLRLKQQGPPGQSRTVGGNVTINVNGWYLLENKFVINSGADVADGTYDAWITPYGGSATHYASVTNVVYKTSGNTHGFTQWHDQNIYGGAGSVSKTRADYILIDDILMTGNP